MYRGVHRSAFPAIALQRIGHAAVSPPGPAGMPMRLARKALRVLSLVVGTVSGIELSWHAEIGRRVLFTYQGGIVVAAWAEIGDDCLVRQNVTIGLAREGGGAPRIGRNVEIGVGAVIVGDVTVGDGALIGPNAVVTTDVPAGARVVAAPSRIILVLGESGAVPKGPNDDSEPDAAEIASMLRDLLGSRTEIDVDTPLLSSGLVDSLNVALVLDALESRFDVRVAPETVSAETLDTPRQIAEYLGTRRSR